MPLPDGPFSIRHSPGPSEKLTSCSTGRVTPPRRCRVKDLERGSAKAKVTEWKADPAAWGPMISMRIWCAHGAWTWYREPALNAGDRLWSRPSINAIGIDMTSIAGSSNVLIPEARAKISMRIVPGADPARELDALVEHLEANAPWGAQVEVQRTKEAPPFECDTSGPGYAAARWALAEAFGKPAGEAGSGGSIPLLRTLQQAAPKAEFVLWGPEDVALSRIHSSDESVDPAEIERMVLAQVLLLQRLAERRP